MKAKLKKMQKIITATFITLSVLVAFLLHGPRLISLQPYCVLSGSMASVYPTGSLIYVAAADPGELDINDIITFQMSGGVIATHRIIELVPDESNPDVIRFRTKGDENNVADGTLVDSGSVIGTPVFCIPYLGYLAMRIMQPSGKYFILTIAVALILIDWILSIAFEEKDSKKANTTEP